jgi:hypothetical protein
MMRIFFEMLRLGGLLTFVLMASGCAHQINIGALETPARNEATLIKKNVAYVMTDEIRNKVVTTDGGGGDKVSYYAYRDLEKVIRDSLRSIYQGVIVLKSASDAKAISDSEISLIFTPELSTTSRSDSLLTWPPTQFFINLTCMVTDPDGKQITQLRITGNGSAEFSEFKADLGLAGRRAASDLGVKFKKEIGETPSLQ